MKRRINLYNHLPQDVVDNVDKVVDMLIYRYGEIGKSLEFTCFFHICLYIAVVCV